MLNFTFLDKSKKIINFVINLFYQCCLPTDVTEQLTLISLIFSNVANNRLSHVYLWVYRILTKGASWLVNKMNYLFTFKNFNNRVEIL